MIVLPSKRPPAGARIIASAVAVVAAVSPALAQSLPAQQPATPSVWTQPTLLDVPGGPKEVLRQHGVSVDLWWTQFYQGLLAGDGNPEWQYGGKGDVIVTVDGGKLGLWNGLFVNFHEEMEYGRNANLLGDGSLIPLNTALAFPRLGGSNFNTSLTVTQVFPQGLSVSLGKFNMLDAASKTPLMGGGGLDTFMHLGLAAPISGVTPPYILGGIATLKTTPATFALMVYDPRNAQNDDVMQHPFAEGVTTSLSATVPITIAGLQGYYGLRGVYSTKSGFNLSDVPALVLPPESRGSLTKQGYWYGQASFQQFLYQDRDDPKVGWGMFGELALSDGNPNAIKWRGIIGLGGNNPIAGRQLDRWGVAYFKYGLSSDLLDGLARLGIGRQDEQGVEAFYNLSVTPWLRVTADLQWIDPFEPQKKNAVIGALRTQIRF